MQSKDMFKLVVRLLGLVFLYHALQAVQPALVLIIDSFPDSRTHGSFGKFCAGIFMVGWPLLVSYWLLSGAPWVMRLAYPEAPASTPAERAFEAQARQESEGRIEV
jgi:hypothetical protein